MFKLLTRLPLARFSRAPEIEKVYELKFHVKDLTLLRGMNSSNPYFHLQGKKISLPKDKLILSIEENMT